MKNLDFFFKKISELDDVYLIIMNNKLFLLKLIGLDVNKICKILVIFNLSELFGIIIEKFRYKINYKLKLYFSFKSKFRIYLEWMI